MLIVASRLPSSRWMKATTIAETRRFLQAQTNAWAREAWARNNFLCQSITAPWCVRAPGKGRRRVVTPRKLEKVLQDLCHSLVFRPVPPI
jgi:hypothetical protein